ncbi:hypothetical protein FOXB_04478 [Fusarium oxysporum f. sp. conglutinans Fo5176]|uniref:Uncharacterized protein n=1 Tax=Fusarium oxysporum (strain Fo5176) TaxID=660025 RepID=F9FDK0_FUSOF|nr:hypothetical protein FOXB_04478 [Fusarium oxysporum f. sp. conglutinans Fo5176]
MTTNSFGGPLPPFDFPAQPAPAVSRMARISKALPIVLVAASVAAYFNILGKLSISLYLSQLKPEPDPDPEGAVAIYMGMQFYILKLFYNKKAYKDLIKAIKVLNSY